MPLIRVDSFEASLQIHGSPAAALPALAHAARQGDGPIIIMVHGFNFRPGDGRYCPHRHIFGLTDEPCRKIKSWPQRLGFTTGQQDEGLGLAFGWDSKGLIWEAYARAAQAGEALARAIRTLRRAAPEREVHAIAHSLGARVVLQALPHLQPGDLGRIIALNGAEFASVARAALSKGAGPETDFIAVTSRENAGFDLMLEYLVTPPVRGDHAIGRAPLEGAGCAHIRLDRADVIGRLATLGFPLAAEKRLFCHWSTYLRGGTLSLYAALMRQAATLPLDALLPDLAPAQQVMLRRPLPLGHKTPS